MRMVYVCVYRWRHWGRSLPSHTSSCLFFANVYTMRIHSTCTWEWSYATWTVRTHTPALDRARPSGRADDDVSGRGQCSAPSSVRRSAGRPCRSAAASSPPPSRRRSGPSGGCWRRAGSVWRLGAAPPPFSAHLSRGRTPAGSRTASDTSTAQSHPSLFTEICSTWYKIKRKKYRLHWESRQSGSVVECRSSAGVLSLSCARPVADRWPLMWVNRPL